MKTELDVCLGKVGTSVGKLVFVRNGPRVFTRFAYFQDWLDNKDERNVTGAEVLALKLASLAGL